MLKTYLQTAIRNLRKRKSFLVINVLGFSLGVCVAILMFAYVWDEIGYDTYHPDHERVYRVALNRYFPDRQNSYATTPPPLGPTIVDEFPEIQSQTRVFDLNQIRVKVGDRIFYEDRAYAADSTFFDLFGVHLLEGSTEAFKAPNAVVITEDMNRKYFGEEGGLDQLVEIGDTTRYRIAGICENVPKKSHFRFDMLISFRTFPVSGSTFWGSYSTYNYVKLWDESHFESVNAKLPEILEPHFGPQVESILGKTYQEYVEAGNIHDYFLQPIQSIHLNSRLSRELAPNGDIQYVILFVIVAVMILAIACFNFTNLSTGYAVNRSKEIGVRKVLGSSRRQLTFQFLTESTIIAILAVVLSFLVACMLLPYFNQFAGKEIALSDFHPLGLVSFLLLLGILVGVLSGLYPATFMSSLAIIKIFKGGVTISNRKFGLRNILVTFQFCASLFMVLATLFIVRQLDFMRNQKLGFEKDNMVLLEVSNVLGSRYRTFVNELENHPEVAAVTTSFHIPGRESGGGTFQAIGNSATERFLFSLFVTGYDFHATYGLDLISGRFFEDDLSSDSAAVVINRACARMVGWSPEEAIGKEVLITGQDSPRKIVGVLQDFHFASLHETIRPMVFIGVPERNINTTQPQTISIRLQPNVAVDRAIQHIEETWSSYIPSEPLRYSFLKEDFNDLYENEILFARLFKSFALLAIVISGFGVIGLSFFIAAERVKEIGIRKVLGATISQIMVILSKDFLMLSLVANLIVWPIAFLLISRWLDSYAYSAGINYLYFPIAGLSFTVIMIMVISIITFQAAMRNPVEAIGRE